LHEDQRLEILAIDQDKPALILKRRKALGEFDDCRRLVRKYSEILGLTGKHNKFNERRLRGRNGTPSLPDVRFSSVRPSAKTFGGIPAAL
jgi:hypothetical protein